MPGKCQKIHIQILYVHCHMGHALGSVCHEISACFMCQLCKTLDIVFAAQHIGYLGHGNDLRSVAQCLLKSFLGIFSVFGALQILHHRSGPGCRLLPGQEIAVMLHNAHQDLISRFQYQGSETVRHQV